MNKSEINAFMANTRELTVATVAEAQALTFPNDGGDFWVRIEERGGAKFKTSDTGSGDGFSSLLRDDGGYLELDESAPTLRAFGCLLDGVDDTLPFMAACEWSRINGTPIVETMPGTLRYTTEADFSASGAGLIWAGVTKAKLLYAGADFTDAVKVTSGGSHEVLSVSAESGSFEYGEVLTGSTSGARAVCRQRFTSHPLEVQMAHLDFQVGETITGGTTGATATLDSVTPKVFGDSLQDIKLKGFTIRADRTQAFDGFSRPLDWAEQTGLYLSGFRNGCEVKDVRPEGFRYGHYSKFNWIFSVRDCKPHTCWASHTLDGECNSGTFEKNSASRPGDVTDTSGWGLLFTSSYGTDNKAFDMEQGNSQGIIYENLRGCSHTVGDIESNGNNAWQLKIRGLPGTDFNASGKTGWTKGFSVDGARFREDLGIEFDDGVSGCAVRASHWNAESLVGNNFIARVRSGATHLENIVFENSNSYYGDNETYQPDIPLQYQASTMYDAEVERWQNVISQPLDITNPVGQPVAYLPKGAKITQVDYIANNTNPPTTAGSFEVDLGLDANLGVFYVDDVVTIATGGSAGVDGAPYGYYGSKTTGINESSSAGMMRARIDTNSAGTGEIYLRVWYSLNHQ